MLSNFLFSLLVHSTSKKYLKHLLSFATFGMLLLQLLCQYERNSVLKFLETFESYRVEHCLRLCQEYGIIDAAAFLLERVGNVGTLGSALLLTLSGLDEKFIALDAAVESLLHDAGSEHFSTVSKKEVCLNSHLFSLCRDCVAGFLTFFPFSVR